MLDAIDDGVGTVTDALESAGLTKDTLVVFTTEHGLAMPRAKAVARIRASAASCFGLVPEPSSQALSTTS